MYAKPLYKQLSEERREGGKTQDPHPGLSPDGP